MQVNALFAATPKPFGPRGAPSSIIKSPVDTITVEMDHTLEDEQGNKKLHGGPEKVLHQYGPMAYDTLKQAFPTLGDLSAPGNIGENLSVEGMEDTNVCVGDVYQIGNVVIQVSAPRAPCNKISHRFDVKNLDRFVGENGITGWYYRVIQTGTIRNGDTVTLIERPEKTVTIHDLMKAVFLPELADKAAEYMELEVLDDEWREKCQRQVRKFLKA